MSHELNPITEQKISNRRWQSVVFVGFILCFAGSLAFRGQALAVAIVVPALVASVAGIRWLIVTRERSRGSARRREGADPSWPAMLPVWAARRLGANPSAGQRDSIDLTGRLHVEPGMLVWIPSTMTARAGVQPVRWIGPRDTWIRPTWGIVPLAYLQIDDANLGPADLLVRDPRDLADALARALRQDPVPPRPESAQIRPS